MLIAMTFFKDYKENRIEYVKKAYNYFSKHKINLPTPIMAGVRTPMKSYASCSLFTVDDDLRSIFSNNSAVGFATASRYGIGLNLSRLRATNASIRNGEVVHTGPIPFAKAFESTVKSCHQNGIRGGSATVNFAWFHYDILDILVLKNNQGTDDNRVRKLDYSRCNTI
jgi:ribonucleoside-diphosphate reductase alpha chain